MIKKIKLLIPTAILIFLLILSTTAPPIGNYTTQQKQEDFLFVYDLLAKEYPFFGVLERKYNINWLAKKSTYLERINATKNDTQFYNELKKIIGELYDGHTKIINPSYYSSYKLIYSCPEASSNVYYNEFYVKPINNSQKNYNYWSEILGYATNNVQDNKSSVKSLSLKKYHSGDTLYIKIKAFKMSVEECKQLYDFILANESCPNIIVDIRDNYGGSDYQWLSSIVSPLNDKEYKFNVNVALRGANLSEKYAEIFCDDKIEDRTEVSQRPNLPNYPPDLATDFKYILRKVVNIMPKNPIDFNGSIYVLVNNKVYSAAEGFASFCKKTGFATLVGERTKGDGGSTPPILVRLPNSGLLLRMRLQLTLNPDGSANAEVGTSPDIPVRARNALTETLKIIEGKTK